MPQLQAEAESPQREGKNPGHLPEMQASVYQKGIKSGPPKLRGSLFCCSWIENKMRKHIFIRFDADYNAQKNQPESCPQ